MQTIQMKRDIYRKHTLIDGSSPPVGKLLLNCDSERGRESSHESAGTTANKEKPNIVSMSIDVPHPLHGDTFQTLNYPPSYLLYLVSEGSPKKVGMLCTNLSLQQKNIKASNEFIFFFSINDVPN